MRVLYIHRRMYDESGWLEKTFKHLGQKLKRKYTFDGRYSFFRASLHKALDTDEKNLDFARKVDPDTVRKKYDWIIFSHEAHYPDEEPESFQELMDVKQKFDVPSALFIGHPHPSYLPPESVLDAYDLIFKREPYKDRDRYSISPENQQKIRPTILHCPFITPNILTLNWTDPTNYGIDSLPEQYDYDVFFKGRDCNSFRREIWGKVEGMDLRVGGGLYEGSSNYEKLPDPYKTEKSDLEQYQQEMNHSKINLALRGAGPFTHRHLEIWATSGFCLSDSKINEIEFPFDVEQGTHYVSFETKEELNQKINCFLHKDQKRQYVAQKGRKLFEEEYDYHKHGRFLSDQLSSNSTTS